MTTDTYGTAVELLAMPKTHTLTKKKLSGTVCVWCGKHLDEDGLKLGPRLRVASGGVQRWLPRACRPCAGREAARVCAIHITTCARCSHHDYCPDSRALHRLALECR